MVLKINRNNGKIFTVTPVYFLKLSEIDAKTMYLEEEFIENIKVYSEKLMVFRICRNNGKIFTVIRVYFLKIKQNLTVKHCLSRKSHIKA